MISTDIQTRIIEAISANRRNYQSDAKHATALGISTSVYSSIKNGDTAQKLSDGNWITIARRLGVSINNERPWKIVKTPTFEYIYSQLEACQQRSLSGMFWDLPDIGKTVTAKYYAQANRGQFMWYIQMEKKRRHSGYWAAGNTTILAWTGI